LTRHRTPGASAWRLLGLCLLSFLTPTLANAQAVAGTILGTVKDASAAVIPGSFGHVWRESTRFLRPLSRLHAGRPWC